MTRLFLISERRLLAEALAAALEQSSRLALAGFAPWSADLAEGLASGAATHEGAEMLLLDAGVDARRALEIALELQERGAAAKLVVLGLEQPRQVLDFLESGAAAYTLQEDSLGEVLHILEELVCGRSTCHPAVAGLVFSRIGELARRAATAEPVGAAQAAASADEAFERLSERELEVLEQLAAGRCNKDVAHRLEISPATVRNHVQKIMSKLRVHRRRDAIRRAYEEGILREPLPWPSV